MPTLAFEYAVIRVVPRVERQEFLNAGVLLSCIERRFLQARLALDARRLRAFAPATDLDTIQAHLQAIARVCEGHGPIGRLSQRARFHWLVAPRSTVVQLSPVHAGLCDDPEAALDRLLDRMVYPPAL